MRIQIMGAGALGSLFGAFLLKAGFDVVFVARGEQLKALQSRGLTVSGLMDEHLDVAALDRPVDSDLVFLTVKAYDTENAARQLEGTRFRAICSLQNGVGNEEILARHFENVVGGVTTYGANLREPGHVVYAGEGATLLGDFRGSGAEEFELVLREAGVNVEVVEDIERRIWEKACINAVINPITAVCRVRNGKIVEVPELWEVARRIARECREVMVRMGYDVDVESVARDVAVRTAMNRSSMLQDIEKGKRTEIDFINGAFVRKARELGIDATYNEVMVRLVRGIELGVD
ncbi:ketopantoate reductase family protein [Geoglobus sp.]